jgi:protoporphyrinogen/coproporphyrinogen III oxidase
MTGAAARPRVVIVGGGITGLATAYALTRDGTGCEPIVLEAEGRLGGNIRTVAEHGYVMDTGPDSFLVTKPEALELCRQLGLERRLIETRAAARRVYFVHRGRLEEMPAGMALGIPTRIEPLLSSPLLSRPGKVRMLSEPLVPAGGRAHDESIHEFFARRFGEEAAARLAAPLLGGVYAGDTRALSMRATFPQMVQLEARHRSLVRGLFAAQAEQTGVTFWQWLRRTPEAHPPSPFRTLDGGLGVLVEELAARLHPGGVRQRTPVTRLARGPGGWRVETPGGALEADVVVLAIPARCAADLVPDAEAAALLGAVPFVSTATVFFGFDQRAVERSLDAVGFVAPEGEAALLAATWVSSKWPGRAPEGKVLMRAFIGGARDGTRAETASDAELSELALSELRRLMGRLDTPELCRVFRYPSASAQPVVGHLDRMTRLAERLAGLPGLHVAGSGYDGIGIPDCIRQANAIAREISSSLAVGG